MQRRQLPAADGSLLGKLGTVQALTEQTACRDRLRLLESALQQMEDGFVISGEGNHLVYVNRGFERLTGYRAEEVLGRKPRMLKSGHQHPWFYRDLWTALGEGRTWRGRFVNRRKDGTEYLEEMTITPLVGADGGRLGYVAHKRDITDEADGELSRVTLEREATIGQFAGEIAHELKIILTAIFGNIEIVAVPGTNRDSVATGLRDIEIVGAKGMELARRLMSFFRGDSNAPEPRPTRALLEESSDLARIPLPPTVSLSTAFDSVGRTVRTDPIEFQQIILNLVSNTRDALRGRPGVVSFHAYLSSPEDSQRPKATVELPDSGPGMSPETLPASSIRRSLPALKTGVSASGCRRCGASWRTWAAASKRKVSSEPGRCSGSSYLSSSPGGSR